MGRILNRKTSIEIAAILICFLITLMIRAYFSTRTVQAFVTPVDVAVDEPVFFSDSTQRAKQWVWNFGNGDTLCTKSGKYKYKSPGKYQIKLTVDGSIEKKMIVNVKPEIKADITNTLIKIIAPGMAIQGENVIFKGEGEAKEWRWDFGETVNIDSRERTPIYAYQEPGIYEVQLTTENTRYPIRHTIEILPKYMDNDSTDVFVLVGNDIKEKLQAIVDGKPFNTNFNYIMKNYLCDNPDVVVIVNNSKKNDFYSYCQGLRIIGRKKTIIDNVIVDVDENNSECVLKLTVTQYEK
ncbi:PKD domain-containing protein [Bacteroides fragilis]|uniref:PKD domain-containing protein n=1 Tax=Bacteroides fragilis TaxID=817 RepID=A0A396BPI4_BACFG|nr:PKD domain-containing protein [Bacteroides fragilis]RHH07900.1 PKD domain-containing protein [Bacteroides fragilis]